MVKRRKKHNRKKYVSKGYNNNGSEPIKIKASTAYGTCRGRLNSFEGLLALIKFLDLIRFKEIFDHSCRFPARDPRQGNYLMVVGRPLVAKGFLYKIVSFAQGYGQPA